jgi:general stress protein 26
MSASDPNPRQKFLDLLKRFDTAMLVTHTAAGGLRARPMAIARVEDTCRVWFFTSVASGKVHEIETDTHVNVVCQKERDIYLSLSGIATLRRDRAKIEELWQETYKVWFPGGKDDPELALVSVEPQDGEFWDEEGFKKIKYLFEAAKAYATGTTPQIAEGEQHAKVNLQPV